MFTRFLSPVLCFTFLLFASAATYGQETLNTFEMEFDGEKVMATQDIDPQFLGTYMQKGGKCKRMFALGTETEESYILTQTESDPFSDKYDWDPKNKKAIEWGVLTINNEIVYMQVKEYSEGHMKTFTGIVILYKNLETQKYKDVLLYKVNGNLVLGGFATKVTEVVAN